MQHSTSKDRKPQSRPSRRMESLAAAAQYAGVTTMTIRRRIAAGDLTGYRFGPRLIRVDLDELDAAMQPIPTGTRPAS